MAFVTCHSGGARCRAGCEVWLLPGSILAVLSPWALSQPLPLSRPLVPLGWPRVPGATAVPVPGGTGQPGHEDPAAADSGILWKVQAQSCLSFVLQKEKQPLTEHKEGGDEP